MKHLLALLLIVATFTGCSRESDARLAKLKVEMLFMDLTNRTERASMSKEIDFLRRQLATNDAVLTDVMWVMKADRRVMTNHVEKETLKLWQIMDYRITNDITSHLAALRANASAARTVSAAPASAALARPRPALADGMPAAIYDEIAADAARRHPGDFSVQKYLIGQQIDAWKKLNGR